MKYSYYNKIYSTLITLMISLGFVTFICFCVLISITLVKAQPEPTYTDFSQDSQNVKEVITIKETIIKDSESICPHTKMNVHCFTCHNLRIINNKATWIVKEIDLDAWRKYPLHEGMEVKTYNGEEVGYYEIKSLNTGDIKLFFDYLDRHQIEKAVIEIYCIGGTMPEALRGVGLIEAWQNKERIVETRIYGIAFSAGFMVFVAGSPGHRFISPTAELMWHELQVWKQPGLTTPSDSEQKAEIYRHIQNTVNDWLMSRSRMSKEELDEKVKNKEFWLNGKEAVEYGFADEFIGSLRE